MESQEREWMRKIKEIKKWKRKIKTEIEIEIENDGTYKRERERESECVERERGGHVSNLEGHNEASPPIACSVLFHSLT